MLRTVRNAFSKLFQRPHTTKVPRSILQVELLEDRLTPAASVASSSNPVLLAAANPPAQISVVAPSKLPATIAAVAKTASVSAPAVISLLTTAATTTGPVWNKVANALVLPSGQIVPLLPITKPMNLKAIGYVQSNPVQSISMVTAYREDGTVFWSKPLGTGQLFGGFDLDGDGIPDFGLARTEPTGRRWLAHPVQQTTLFYYRGIDGKLLGRTGTLVDRAWSFPGTSYLTSQWTAASTLFGAGKTLLVSPQYAVNGWFFQLSGSALKTAGTFYFPSTENYSTDTYTLAQPNAYNPDLYYQEYSHLANGLIVQDETGEKAVFWTSGRVVQYRVGPYDADQLLADDPYLNGDRTDLAGRNYGLVTRDPNYPDHITLLSGTSVASVYSDMISRKIAADPWGGIERHVEIYSLSGTDPLQHRFYSSAHDGGDAYKYQNRLVYPTNPYLRSQPGTPSRLAYNIFSQGHWYLHISQPGSTADARVYKDVFLWDIKDLNGDGKDELITSPTNLPPGSKSTVAYFPQWTTALYNWEETNAVLVYGRKITDGIPLILQNFRKPTTSSTEGYLFPISVALIEGKPHLILTSATGQQLLVDVSQVK